MISRVNFWSKTHIFKIIGPGTYYGKNFLLTAQYDGVPVNAQWSIIDGNEYATINSYGRLDINSNILNQYVTIRATYKNYIDNITILISYNNQLDIYCPDNMRGVSGNCVAMYNNTMVTPMWSIITGNEYATINSSGEITILNTGDITVQAEYSEYTARKQITVVYDINSSTETIIDENGVITETTITTITDPETGITKTEEISVVINNDGSTSHISKETIVNPDNSSTIHTTTTNPNGSTNLSTSNYNSDGDPVSTINNEIDPENNKSTQNIEYNENNEPIVVEYVIDTSCNPDGEKTFNGDGVNTGFYAFDLTRGFVIRMHFTVNLENKPANQDGELHNILTMKRADPQPWYGFQLRQKNTDKFIHLGTQFSTGSNTNTSIQPPRWIETNKIAEYDVEITYDPTKTKNTFVCKELISDKTVYTSNYKFPNIPELEYLKVTIGCALDTDGNMFRYSDINVFDFSISKI